jgi:hypothetical protein
MKLQMHLLSAERCIKDNTREFCKKMVTANKIYRKEDIQRMSREVVNAGWGARGADKYDIFLYKGGGACHHKWTCKKSSASCYAPYRYAKSRIFTN